MSEADKPAPAMSEQAAAELLGAVVGNIAKHAGVELARALAYQIATDEQYWRVVSVCGVNDAWCQETAQRAIVDTEVALSPKAPAKA